MRVRVGMSTAVMVLNAGLVFGQATNSADVTGTVTDKTGAVIAGVTINIKDLDKGQLRTITSNGAGAYDSGPIVPNDNYTITFSREGFAITAAWADAFAGRTNRFERAVGRRTDHATGCCKRERAAIADDKCGTCRRQFPLTRCKHCRSLETPDWQSFLTSASRDIRKCTEPRRTPEWVAWRRTGACRFQPRCWMALR